MEKPLDSRYPKAKYKRALEGLGDVKSPAYEKIVSEGGEAKRLVEFHPYMTTTVANEAEEAALGEGWYDTPTEAEAAPKPREPAKKEK